MIMLTYYLKNLDFKRTNETNEEQINTLNVVK